MDTERTVSFHNPTKEDIVKRDEFELDTHHWYYLCCSCILWQPKQPKEKKKKNESNTTGKPIIKEGRHPATTYVCSSHLLEAHYNRNPHMRPTTKETNNEAPRVTEIDTTPTNRE